jgi:hypothetical protein
MGGRTIYKTLSPKGHLFKLRLTDDRTFERCLEEDELATHISYVIEAIAYFRFRHVGQFFMEPSDYYDTPLKSPTFSQPKGRISVAHPLCIN